MDKGYMVINYIKYDVKEYLPQATILICSKCMGLGHFRKQCKPTEVTCKVCSERCDDMKNHNCSGTAKCIHCGGNHSSNAYKCKVIKQFRALISSPSRPFMSHIKSKSDFPNLSLAQKTKFKALQSSKAYHDGQLTHQADVIGK